MKNSKTQTAFSQEEPVLNYLLEKIIRKNPNNNFDISAIENAANDLLAAKNPKIESNLQKIIDNYSQEEVNESMVKFFEELAFSDLSELQQLQKANAFLRQFGFKISQDQNGNSSVTAL